MSSTLRAETVPFPDRADPARARARPERVLDGGTRVHHQRFRISFDYPVYFTRGALAVDNPALVESVTRHEPGRRHRLLAVVDGGVAAAWPHLGDALAAYAAHHGDRLELAAAPEIVPGGERAKNDPDVIHAVLARIHREALDRQAFVVAVGGGAVLDMAGFAAAVSHRGVRLVRLPTTVLAQNDSGVGVKTGVNRFDAKNYLGAFAPPFAVINDFDFISTLERRDKVSGMAEAVKVALIRDRAFFEWLERNADLLSRFEPRAMERMIADCAEHHLRHIGGCGDPFELGSSRPLDFGHWAAHKLESLSHHALRHGEAVAIGIALDSRYSVLAGLLRAGEDVRICALLERLGFRLWHDALDATGSDGAREVIGGIAEFREHLGGELTVSMLEQPGRAVDVHEIDVARMLEAIAWLRHRDRSALPHPRAR